MNASIGRQRLLRSALWLPLFDELADPAAVTRLAAEAEEAGWHGMFVWDHLFWQAPIRDVADPWITLAAMAAVTTRLRLGPMVTPLARRRPAKVARETATLDRLSDGRLILGVGLGSDRFGSELSMTGEPLDDRRRARMLDESLEILTAAWTASRSTTTVSTSRSTAHSSFPDRCVSRACRCGSPASPENSSHCTGRRATTVSFPSISNTMTTMPAPIARCAVSSTRSATVSPVTNSSRIMCRRVTPQKRVSSASTSAAGFTLVPMSIPGMPGALSLRAQARVVASASAKRVSRRPW